MSVEWGTHSMNDGRPPRQMVAEWHDNLPVEFAARYAFLAAAINASFKREFGPYTDGHALTGAMIADLLHDFLADHLPWEAYDE